MYSIPVCSTPIYTTNYTPDPLGISAVFHTGSSWVLPDNILHVRGFVEFRLAFYL